MKILSLVLTITSAISGLWASYKWYRASRVNFVPFEEVDGQLIPVCDVGTWVQALRGTLQKSGRMNTEAAFWTAISVALAGLSALATLM